MSDNVYNCCNLIVNFFVALGTCGAFYYSWKNIKHLEEIQKEEKRSEDCPIDAKILQLNTIGNDLYLILSVNNLKNEAYNIQKIFFKLDDGLWAIFEATDEIKGTNKEANKAITRKCRNIEQKFSFVQHFLGSYINTLNTDFTISFINSDGSCLGIRTDKKISKKQQKILINLTSKNESIKTWENRASWTAEFYKSYDK